MKAYQESAKDPTISGFDLRGKHSWDEVLRVAQDAEAIYMKRGERRLRKAARFIADKSEAATPYLRLIPNAFYTSILFGGLKLIFGVRFCVNHKFLSKLTADQAAARISERRDAVLKTLLRIPPIIIQAEHCVETFPSDPALYDGAAELYLAVLTTVEGITKWLMQKSACECQMLLICGPVNSV